MPKFARKGKIRDLELFPMPWINVGGPTLVIFRSTHPSGITPSTVVLLLSLLSSERGVMYFGGGGLRWMTKFVICACPASPPVGSAGAPLLNGQKPSCVVGEYCPNSKHGIGLMLSQLRNHKQENLIQGWVGRKVGKRTDYENKKKVRPSVSFWQREEEIRNGSRTPQPFFLLSIFISFLFGERPDPEAFVRVPRIYDWLRGLRDPRDGFPNLSG